MSDPQPGELLGITTSSDPMAAYDDYRHPPTVAPVIDYGATVGLDELAGERSWPPERHRKRARRLYDLEQIVSGRWSSIIDMRELTDSGIEPINLVGRVVAIAIKLVMREPPRIGDDDRVLWQTASDAMHHAMSFGAAYPSRSDGDGWRTPNARHVWRVEDDGGWVAVEPITLMRHTSAMHDSLQLTHWPPGGQVIRWMREITPTPIDTYMWDMTDAARTPRWSLGSGMIAPALPPPILPTGHWGTDMISELLPIAVQLARANARDTAVIDEHAHPTLILRGQFNRALGSARDLLSAAVKSLGVSEWPDIVMRHDRTAKRIRRHGVLPLQDGTQFAEYLTWDGNLSASMQLQSRLDGWARMMSGVTAILGSDQAIPSGMSLKRLFFVADAQTHYMRMTIWHALQEIDPSVTWDDAFSQVDATNRQDVESEARADRGQNQAGDDEPPDRSDDR